MQRFDMKAEIRDQRPHIAPLLRLQAIQPENNVGMGAKTRNIRIEQAACTRKVDGEQARVPITEPVAQGLKFGVFDHRVHAAFSA